ncbi:hypothetical protein [Defluviitalea phaphyphila]|nr:hypothetical protein [Defluviitalea phaphyphila]
MNKIKKNTENEIKRNKEIKYVLDIKKNYEYLFLVDNDTNNYYWIIYFF